MPTVPRRTGLGVQSSPLPTERANPNAPAAAFGAAPLPDPSPVLAPLAQAASALYEREKRRADTVAMLDADNRMSALRRGLLTDPDKGIYQQRGRAALEASGKVYDEWQKGVSDIEGSLATDEQKLRFRQYAQAQTAQMRESVDRHVAQEVEREDKDVTDAALSSAVDDAIGNYQRPELVDAAIAKYSAVLGDFAAHHRVPPEALERTRAEGRSKILVGVIGRMLDNGQDLTAKAYYEAHSADIVGGHRGTVEKALEQGTTEGEAQRRADAIIAAKDVTRADAFEQARQIQDPGIRKETEQRLDVEFARRDRAEADRYSGVLDQAWASVYDGKQPPASLRTQLKLSDARAIDVYLRNAARGLKPETDATTYYSLMDLASSADPKDQAAFREGNLLQYRNDLSESDWKRLVDLQMTMRRGDARSAGRLLTGIRTETQVVSAALESLGLKTTAAAGTKQRKKINLFRKLVDDEVVAWKEAHNNAAHIPTTELQKIIDGHVIKDELGLVSFTAAQRDPEDVKGIQDVPINDQRLIREALARKRQPITSENIVQRYREYLTDLRAPE